MPLTLKNVARGGGNAGTLAISQANDIFNKATGNFKSAASSLLDSERSIIKNESADGLLAQVRDLNAADDTNIGAAKQAAQQLLQSNTLSREDNATLFGEIENADKNLVQRGLDTLALQTSQDNLAGEQFKNSFDSTELGAVTGGALGDATGKINTITTKFNEQFKKPGEATKHIKALRTQLGLTDDVLLTRYLAEFPRDAKGAVDIQAFKNGGRNIDGTAITQQTINTFVKNNKEFTGQDIVDAEKIRQTLRTEKKADDRSLATFRSKLRIDETNEKVKTLPNADKDIISRLDGIAGNNITTENIEGATSSLDEAKILYVPAVAAGVPESTIEKLLVKYGKSRAIFGGILPTGGFDETGFDTELKVEILRANANALRTGNSSLSDTLR